MLVSFVLFGFMFAQASRGDDNDLDAYENVKKEYCTSDNQEWSKIDHMLNCYIAASDAKPSVVKDCERKTFASVEEAKAAFCTEQGAQTIGKFNSCVNEQMQQIDPAFTNETHSSDPHDTQFMSDLYHCLILALHIERNNSNVDDANNVTATAGRDLPVIVELDRTTTSSSSMNVTDMSTETVNNTMASVSTATNAPK